MHIRFTKQAEKQFGGLARKDQERIAKKIRWFASQKEPLEFAKPVKGFSGVYRFRVGFYRLIFSVENNTMILLTIEKRDSVYKKM